MGKMVARVVLRKAMTYSLGGKRWIKDVPGIVKGESKIEVMKANGYFHVHVLKTGKPKSEEQTGSKKSNKSKGKGGSKKTGKSKLKKN